jgi:GntR family transcriptional regulator/MocR family aminotransferase
MDLRQAIAEHLGPARGIRARASQVIITGGIQEALNIISRLLIRAGTPVVIEDPCYQGAAFTFESYGAEIIPTPVDSAGIQVRRLPERSVSLAYVTPSHQFPVGATMSLNRRMKLIEWANRVGAYLVEDDYDSDFRYDGPPLTALAGMDSSGTVIYLGTFSKSIGAGLRLGYMVVPSELAEPASVVKTILNNGNGWLNQAALADFIKSGSYSRHLRRIRKEYKSRLEALIEAVDRHLKGATITGDKGGMHVMLHLPADGPTASQLEKYMRSLGVGIYSLRSGAAIDFAHTTYSDRGLVLGYSSLTEVQIKKGVERIAAGIEQLRETSTASSRPARDS